MLQYVISFLQMVLASMLIARCPQGTFSSSGKGHALEERYVGASSSAGLRIVVDKTHPQKDLENGPKADCDGKMSYQARDRW